MIDKVLAAVSLAGLIAFMGIIVWFVPEPDLTIVTILVLAMAFRDFYYAVFRGKGSD